MLSISAIRAYLAISLALTRRTSASPQVAFSINSQLPPVAYVSRSFEYTFAPNTFSSDATEISYGIANQPEWLSLDGPARRLSGTPISESVGAATFEVTASDNNGRVSSNVTLVVLQTQTLFPNNEAVAWELAKVGNLSAPATLLYHPGQAVTFSLSAVLFIGVSRDTKYYAVSSDGSPLPSWLQFDSATGRFSGMTPPLLGPSPARQEFLFSLVASNVVGFSEARVQFGMLISDHLLTTTETIVNVTATAGQLLQTPSLLDRLLYDGLPIRRDQIESTETNKPSWLQFNSDNLSFSGVPNEQDEMTTFSLVIRGLGANSVNITIAVKTENQQNLPKSLGNVTATGGTYFTYTIQGLLELNETARTTITGSNLPEWLNFTSANLTLHGSVPGNVSSELRSISFLSSADNLNVTVADLTLITVPGSLIDSTSTPNSNNSISGRRIAIIVLAIVLPILAVALVICAILIWMRKRKQKQIHDDGPSQVIMQETGSGIGDILSIPGSVVLYENTSQATNSVPQIELPWAPDSHKKTRKRLSKRPRNSQSTLGSSWDDLIDFRLRSKDRIPPLPVGYRGDQPAALSGPQKSQKRPARLNREVSGRQTHRNRISKPPGMGTFAAPGMPKRLSAAGHGAGGGLNTINADPRSSWQTTMGAISAVTSKPDMAMLDLFPEPPSRTSADAISSTRTSPQKSKFGGQPTIQLIESDSDGSFRFTTTASNISTQILRNRLQDNVWASSAALQVPSPYRSFGRNGGQLVKSISSDTDGESLLDERVYRTPPIPQRSHARGSSSQMIGSDNRRQTPFNSTMGNRELSAASSRQFDSAVSSDSQWEDDNLVVDENAIEEVYWQTRSAPSKGRQPPGLPFKLYKQAERGAVGSRVGSSSYRPRLADRRKQVSIEDTELQRTERSYKGSLRFI